MVNKIIVGLLFILAFFVRIWGITSYPVSLSMDEAAIGYNAYSILKTGKDEFGESFPLAFRSAGDFKPPVDVYLTVPSIYVFGLNELGVRFPVAIIGALTVVVLVFLLRSLEISKNASYLTAFWLAILPWHIHFSRGSFEAITALFFLLLGLLLFIKFVKDKNKWFAIFSATAFSLSVWAYHAERLFVPIIVIFLFLLFKPKKNIKVFILTTLIFAVPFIKLSFLTPAIKERAASTSILRETSLAKIMHNGNYTDLKERLFDNDVYLVYSHWMGKYLNYFDIRFWFWKGMQFTPPGYPDLGLLMAIDLPVFLLGVYGLAKSKNKNLKALSLFWFFAGPFPASLTMNEQHPLRALTWIPFFAFIIASGFEYLLTKFKLIKVVIIYLILAVINFVYFCDIYLNQFPRHQSEYWQYGYKDAVIYACNNRDKYKKIVLTDTFGSYGPLNTGLPYLYFLVYCDWDRSEYLATNKHQAKIEFRRPNKEDFNSHGSLLIGSTWDFLDGLEKQGKIVQKITYKNGHDAFLLIEP